MKQHLTSSIKQKRGLVMKKIRSLITMLIITLATATPVLAAAAREDHSNFLVWAFLSVCGLIVVVQLLPVIFMAFGLITGAAKGKKDQEAKANNK
jgi:protein-S-isoprenylcysteine O-methyltransferase Ste14